MASPQYWKKMEDLVWAYNNPEYDEADHIEAKIKEDGGRTGDNWAFVVSTFNHGLQHEEGFDTKEEAWDHAMTWMRGHPYALKTPYWKGTSSHGVGGSYTRWQGKPPAHVQYRFETSYGTLNADFYSRDGESIAGVITQASSDVEFEGLPPEEKEKIRGIAQTLIKHDDFFTG